MAFPYPSFSWLEDNAILTLSGSELSLITIALNYYTLYFRSLFS